MDDARLSACTMKLREKLNKLFDARRLTLDEVAAAVGVSKTTVHSWVSAPVPESRTKAKAARPTKSGRPRKVAGPATPRLDVALRLARLLGVPLEYLADDAQDEPRAVGLSRDEEVVLDMARTLGDYGEAKRRLMAAASAASPARQQMVVPPSFTAGTGSSSSRPDSAPAPSPESVPDSAARKRAR